MRRAAAVPPQPVPRYRAPEAVLFSWEAPISGLMWEATGGGRGQRLIAIIREGQSSGGTTVTMPNSRKCLSKAKAVVMPSRCITTRLTQSVKLHSLS